jgi:hypothetical protein
MALYLNASYITANIITFIWTSLIRKTRTKQNVVQFQSSLTTISRQQKFWPQHPLLFLLSLLLWSFLAVFRSRWLSTSTVRTVWQYKRTMNLESNSRRSQFKSSFATEGFCDLRPDVSSGIKWREITCCLVCVLNGIQQIPFTRRVRQKMQKKMEVMDLNISNSNQYK